MWSQRAQWHELELLRASQVLTLRSRQGSPHSQGSSATQSLRTPLQNWGGQEASPDRRQSSASNPAACHAASLHLLGKYKYKYKNIEILISEGKAQSGGPVRGRARDWERLAEWRSIRLQGPGQKEGTGTENGGPQRARPSERGETHTVEDR